MERASSDVNRFHMRDKRANGLKMFEAGRDDYSNVATGFAMSDKEDFVDLAAAEGCDGFANEST